MDFAVIIAAAGRGTRIASERPKQFLALQGVPILALVLDAFEAAPEIGAILPVIPEGMEHEYERVVKSRRSQKLLAAVPGGSTRQRSVARGLLALPPSWQWVLVHDGARPFVAPELIRAVCAQARRSGAAVPALPSVDTVKEADGAGRVLRTIARDRVFLAQTPQGFRRDLLEDARRRAEAEGFEGTDEASLLERAGVPVDLVPGSPANLKITTAEDLKSAEGLFRSRPR